MSGMRRRSPLTGSALSSRLAQWTQAGILRSVQSGTILVANGTATNTATISVVTVNNTRLTFLGSQTSDLDLTNVMLHLVLTNGTTITATRQGTAAGNVVSYCAEEYVPGILKSRQAGVITSVAASATATIATVNTARAKVDYLGLLTTLNQVDQSFAYCELTNATTVTRTKNGAGSSTTTSYQVPEYFQ